MRSRRAASAQLRGRVWAAQAWRGVVQDATVNQWKQACNEVGIEREDRKRAAEDFHAESGHSETGVIGRMEI